jgi:hypothetical protein
LGTVGGQVGYVGGPGGGAEEGEEGGCKRTGKLVAIGRGGGGGADPGIPGLVSYGSRGL